MSSHSDTALDRGRLALRRHGLPGMLRQVLRRATRRFALSETHVWYALDLHSDYPTVPVGGGVERRRGGAADVHLIEQLQTVSPQEGLRRIEAGNHLNLVLDGERLLHCSFTFTRSMPAIAAHGGELVLPAATVCFEDAVTASELRRTGVAAENLTFAAARLKEEGVRWVIVKIDVANVASRRVSEHGGFEEVALMHHRRIGPWSRSWVEHVRGAAAHELAAQLQSGLREGRS